jgi:hypothetical protein
MKPYLLLSYLLLLSACGLPPAIVNAPAVHLSYIQVSRDINTYKDTPVSSVCTVVHFVLSLPAI